MNAAVNMTIEYVLALWNMRNIILGNHVREPRSSPPKRREFALLVLNIKMASNFSFF